MGGSEYRNRFWRVTTHDFVYIGTRCTISTSALQTVVANAIVNGKCLMHDLKVMVITVGRFHTFYRSRRLLGG